MIHPRRKFRILWSPYEAPKRPRSRSHLDRQTFPKVSGRSWLATAGDQGRGPALAQGCKTLGAQCTAFDGELAAIQQALHSWVHLPHLWSFDSVIVHSDSQSAIARLHVGPDPAQHVAERLHDLVIYARDLEAASNSSRESKDTGVPGNECADLLAGQAAERRAWSQASLAFLRLRTSEDFSLAKTAWDADPGHWGTEEIPALPPMKYCADRARNSVARVAARIRTRHWRSAVFLRQRRDDKCWLCQARRRMSGSYVPLHCNGDRLAAARQEAWEARPLSFLALLGVGRVVEGVDEEGRRATRLDSSGKWGRAGAILRFSFSCSLLCYRRFGQESHTPCSAHSAPLRWRRVRRGPSVSFGYIYM
jgi:ribonuclease HI